MKLYIIKKSKTEYYNAKTNTWVSRIQYATAYRSFTNANKTITQWRLKGEIIELEQNEIDKLMELYNFASFDLCLAFEFLNGKILNFEDQAQAFTMCNVKRIEKLLKEVKKELKPTFKWLDEYDDRAPESTEPIREILLRCSNNLGKVNLVDLPKVDKYLITKAKNNI